MLLKNLKFAYFFNKEYNFIDEKLKVAYKRLS